MSRRAVIFDFDGTMLDSEIPLYEVWRAIFSEQQVDLSLEDWVDYIGAANDSFDPFGDLQKQIQEKLDRRAYEERAMKNYFDYCDQQPLMPGVERLMDFVKENAWGLGLASSSEHHWLDRHLSRLQLKTKFDIVRGREDVAQAKPAPDLFLSAAEGLNVSPKDCIVIEDSLNGLLAAKQAGMYCILIPSRLTEKLDLTAADQRLKTLLDLDFSTLPTQPPPKHTSSLILR